MGEKEIRLNDDLQTIRSQVAHILENFPATRDNDGLLICYWLQMFKGVQSWGGLLSMAQNNVLSFESVRRARQIIQNKYQMYLPQDPSVIKRRGLEDIWRKSLGEM